MHVQRVGLNAETKNCRHRADGEECLLTFPFIGRFYDGDTVSKRLITVSDKFRTDLSATVSKPFGMAQRYTPTNLVSKSAEDARVAVQMCNRLPISVVESMWRSGRVAECDGLEK
jgi:hypothetical protein